MARGRSIIRFGRYCIHGYIQNRYKVVMIMETTDEFSFEEKAKTDNSNKKVVEWEALM